MRSIKEIFNLKSGASYPLYLKEEMNSKDNEALTQTLIQLYDLNNFVLQDKNFSIVLSHPDYGYNVKLTVSLLESSEKQNPSISFWVEHFSKQSHLCFGYKTLTELLELPEGLYPLGVNYSDLEDDQDVAYLMSEFMKSLSCSHLYLGGEDVVVTDLQNQKKILSIIPVNFSDAYGISVENYQD